MNHFYAKVLQATAFAVLVSSSGFAYADKTKISCADSAPANGTYVHTDINDGWKCDYTPVQKDGINPGSTQKLYLYCKENVEPNREQGPHRISMECENGVTCSVANAGEAADNHGVKINCNNANKNASKKQVKISKIECSNTVTGSTGEAVTVDEQLKINDGGTCGAIW